LAQVPGSPPVRMDAPSGGLLGRFDNVQQRSAAKRVVQCTAATPEYLRNDFLKPQHLPIERVDHETNFAPISNINETRFHRGFQRRHQSDIQSDAARLEAEVLREARREERSRASIQAAMEHKERTTFNILTGEGEGREVEFRKVGKKILNPHGSMQAVYSQHGKESQSRIRNSKHRFFEHPVVQKDERCGNLFLEGLTETSRETAVLGYGTSGKRRLRTQSCGVGDNYAHLRALPPEPSWEKPNVSHSHSQIVFG